VSALSSGTLAAALTALGAHPDWRNRIVTLLKEFEASFEASGVNVREEITGPIVDALFRDVGTIEKTLSSGLSVRFRYRSKISRDIVMAGERPDHLWEPQTTKLLLHMAQDIEQAIIGGAYFGDHALLLAQALQARGGVCHCFEVNAEQLQLLRANVAINGLTNVIVNDRGLWDRDDETLVLVGDDSHASPRKAEGDQPGGFQTTTIDTYTARRALDRVSLIMLDIEGGEFAALRGASHHLRQPPDKAPNLIFEVHRLYVDWSDGLENTDIVRLLESHHYIVYAIRDYQGNVPMKDRPVEVIPVRDAFLEGPPHGFNMLAIKRPELIERYSLKVCRGVSPKLLFHRDPRLHQPLH